MAYLLGNQYSVGLDRTLVEPPPRIFRSTNVLTRAITSTASRQMKHLLRKKCDPNCVVSYRQLRPLMVACYLTDKRKRMAIFQCLLKHGADPTLRDVYGRNSMMYVCALGLRDETQLMVKDSDYNLNATDMYGDTLLHFCAKAGNVKVLSVVLDEMLRYEMDISIQNHSYLTPLSLAILNGNYECAKMLHHAGGWPRFSESKLFRIVWLLSRHYKKISSAGSKAIDDSRAVGQAFRGRYHSSHSASSCGNCQGALPALDTGCCSPHAGVQCICNISTTELELRLPQLFPVCKTRVQC